MVILLEHSKYLIDPHGIYDLDAEKIGKLLWQQSQLLEAIKRDLDTIAITLEDLDTRVTALEP